MYHAESKILVLCSDGAMISTPENVRQQVVDLLWERPYERTGYKNYTSQWSQVELEDLVAPYPQRRK